MTVHQKAWNFKFNILQTNQSSNQSQGKFGWVKSWFEKSETNATNVSNPTSDDKQIVANLNETTRNLTNLTLPSETEVKTPDSETIEFDNYKMEAALPSMFEDLILSNQMYHDHLPSYYETTLRSILETAKASPVVSVDQLLFTDS